MSGDLLIHPASALAVKTAALEIMSEHGLGPLLLRRRELERALTTQAAPDWLTSTPTPIHAGRATTEELETVRQACVARIQAVAASHPPFGLALWITTMIQRFLREPVGVGGKVPKDFRDLAAAASEQIIATWAPEFDEEAFAAELSDAGRLRALAQAGPPELGSHPTLGYAPVAQATLLQLGAVSLAPRIDSLLTYAHRESEEWKAWTAELKEARKTHRIWQGSELAVPRIAQATTRVAKERFEAMVAVETLFEGITNAANRFGPFKLRAALRPFLGEFKLPETARDMVFSPASGAAQRGRCLFTRAVIGHSLATLTRTLEEVFPGLLALARADSDADIGQIAQGPSRMSPFREEQPLNGDALIEPLTTEDQLFAGFDRAGLFRILDQAQSHAGALGGLRDASKKAKQRVGVLERVNAFSKSEREEARDGIEARRSWHSEVLRACATSAADIAFGNAGGFFQIDAYRALDRTHQITGALRAELVNEIVLELNEPPTKVLGLVELMATLDRVTAVVGRATGLSGSKMMFANQVAARLAEPARANPFRGQKRLLPGELVARGVAETLRERSGSHFIQLMHEYTTMIGMHTQQVQRSESARRAVTDWDTLNIFTKSPAEQERDNARAQADQSITRAQQSFRRIHAELSVALNEYPPGAVFYGLSEVRIVAEQIHSRARRASFGSRNRNWEVFLVGREQFLGALQHWTAGLMQVFGVLWSPGEILERYAMRNLL